MQANAEHEAVRSTLAIAPERSPTIGEFDEFAFLRGLLRGMRCGVLLIDVEGRLILLNEPARRILNLRDLPPVGTELSRALPDHDPLVRAMLESFRMSSLPNRAEMHLDSGRRARRSVSPCPWSAETTAGHTGRQCSSGT